jgi:hypothetical protein
MNETLKAYCAAGPVVRRMVGYSLFEGLEAATLLAELYRSARLFVNFFQPSFKLIEEQREGARGTLRWSYGVECINPSLPRTCG